MTLLFSLISGLFAIQSCISLHSQTASPEWSTGFWFWSEGAADIIPDPGPVDVLYVHVGTLNHYHWRGDDRWNAYGVWPRELPEAHRYWAVFRCDEHAAPPSTAVAPLAAELTDLRRGQESEGIQLDIDVPTGSLRQYAAFLHELRAHLAPGTKISITALLDWFRDGTAIGEVVKEVDEFVPQFYDTGADREGAIAAMIDAALWGPRFGHFGKPYRIGISTFGRVRGRQVIFRDLTPLELATNPAFRLEVSKTPAQELVLSYRANRPVSIDWQRFEAGSTAQVTIATEDTVRVAVSAAHKMPRCRGVVFFRWPGWEDALVMQPDAVLSAAGVAPPADPKPRIATIDGSCTAVHCIDLYLIDPRPASAPARRFKVNSSAELEYFLPEKKLPVRMTGPSLIELSLPPYCGQRRLYLGRAVSVKPANYSVEELK
jgi:hypothetical protein